MAMLMNEKWVGEREWKLPVMPERVKASDYPCKGIFMGLTCKNIQPVELNLCSHPFLLISQFEAGNDTIALIAQQVIQKLCPKIIILPDFIAGLNVPVTQDMDSVLKELMPELQRRKDSLTDSGLDIEKYPYIMVLIPDLKNVFDKVSNESMKRLNSIAVLGKKLNVILIVQGMAEDINRLYNSGEAFTNSIAQQAVFLLIGDKASAHSVLLANFPLAEKNVLLDKGQGYLIMDKETLKIKILQ